MRETRASGQVIRVIVLLTLSIGAYLPALQLPFIGDDYHQIPIARNLAASGWTGLFHNVNLGSRATYMFLSASLDRVFGFHPMPFYAASILMHTLCVLLLYAAGTWAPIGQPVAFWAACFFAIYEGHQEAVMWLAAAHILIVFLFGMTAWLAWVHWLKTGKRAWYSASLASILMAALSGETFWVFVLLMLAVTLWERRRHGLLAAMISLSPFFILSAVYVIFMFATRVASGARLDDRFAISGVSWIAAGGRGIWDLLFPEGLLAIAVLLWIARRSDQLCVVYGCFWILVGIAPYSFLLYMSRPASRHTYLASAGLALLVGAALSRLSKRLPKAAFAAVCAVVLIANVEILWVKKMAQFRERSEPTELLKAAAVRATGPVTVECTPIPDLVVEKALESVRATAIFPKPENHEAHCFVIEYTGRDGAIVRENRRLGRQHGAFY